MAKIPVYLEVGTKRVFAGSLDWPGWGRFDKGFGKGEEAALEALEASAERYAVVAGEAGLKLPAKVELEVVERLTGDGATDFGVPGKVAERDRLPVDRRAAEKMAALLRASWRVFDRVAAAAPAELRKGPRGGGRDRDRMVRHVVESEYGYARQLGMAWVRGAAASVPGLISISRRCSRSEVWMTSAPVSGPMSSITLAAGDAPSWWCACTVDLHSGCEAGAAVPRCGWDRAVRRRPAVGRQEGLS